MSFQICLFFSILDDMEMYEQQHPFKLPDFVQMSGFLNVFLYKAVMGNLFGKYPIFKLYKTYFKELENGQHLIFIITNYFITLNFLTVNQENICR